MSPASGVAALLLLFCLQSCLLSVDSAVVINWGTLSSHRMPAPVVVDLLEANRIPKAKLFDAERALMGCGIQAMVRIPSELLGALVSSAAACDQWVGQSVTRYMDKGGADIRSHASGTLIAALNRIGFGEVPIAIREVGWPTEGAPTAAADFNQDLVSHVLSNKGAPLTPGVGDSSCGCVGCGIFCSLWLIALWVFIYLRILNSA